MASLEPTKEQKRNFLLDSYLNYTSRHFENVVESTLDSAITNIRNNQNAIKLKELNRKNNTYQDPNDDMYDFLDEFENREILFALCELKIMYLYKHFEIKLKEIALESYKDWQKDREVYRWDDIIKFYLAKDIELKQFASYELINDLIRVNNSLKHSGKKIGNKIRNIPEFRNAEILESKHLDAFYLRVKEAPKEFIKELASLIDSRLFPRVKSILN